MVDESEQFTIPGTGNRVFDLSSPMDCQPGDLVGCWITGAPVGANRVQVSIDANLGVTTGRWVAGDITTSDPFTTLITNKICLEAKASPPFLIVTGDSIPEGHNNGSNNWHSQYHLGPAGTPAAEPANSLRALISGGTLLQYQNFSNGGVEFDWAAATGMPQLHDALPKAILIHCGVNDVSIGRTWAAIDANLNTILAIVHADQKLFIDEILPWTAGSDAQAATLRTFNANIATWCSSNNVRLVACHDDMGQVRPSTGFLDDLKTAYDDDGVHLTIAGVDRLAAHWLSALEAWY